MPLPTTLSPNTGSHGRPQPLLSHIEPPRELPPHCCLPIRPLEDAAELLTHQFTNSFLISPTVDPFQKLYPQYVDLILTKAMVLESEEEKHYFLDSLHFQSLALEWTGISFVCCNECLPFHADRTKTTISWPEVQEILDGFDSPSPPCPLARTSTTPAPVTPIISFATTLSKLSESMGWLRALDVETPYADCWQPHFDLHLDLSDRVGDMLGGDSGDVCVATTDGGGCGRSRRRDSLVSKSKTSFLPHSECFSGTALGLLQTVCTFSRSGLRDLPGSVPTPRLATQGGLATRAGETPLFLPLTRSLQSLSTSVRSSSKGSGSSGSGSGNFDHGGFSKKRYRYEDLETVLHSLLPPPKRKKQFHYIHLSRCPPIRSSSSSLSSSLDTGTDRCPGVSSDINTNTKKSLQACFAGICHYLTTPQKRGAQAHSYGHTDSRDTHNPYLCLLDCNKLIPLPQSSSSSSLAVVTSLSRILLSAPHTNLPLGLFPSLPWSASTERPVPTEGHQTSPTTPPPATFRNQHKDSDVTKEQEQAWNRGDNVCSIPTDLGIIGRGTKPSKLFPSVNLARSSSDYERPASHSHAPFGRCSLDSFARFSHLFFLHTDSSQTASGPSIDRGIENNSQGAIPANTTDTFAGMAPATAAVCATAADNPMPVSVPLSVPVPPEDITSVGVGAGVGVIQSADRDKEHDLPTVEKRLCGEATTTTTTTTVHTPAISSVLAVPAPLTAAITAGAGVGAGASTAASDGRDGDDDGDDDGDRMSSAVAINATTTTKTTSISTATLTLPPNATVTGSLPFSIDLEESDSSSEEDEGIEEEGRATDSGEEMCTRRSEEKTEMWREQVCVILDKNSEKRRRKRKGTGAFSDDKDGDGEGDGEPDPSVVERVFPSATTAAATGTVSTGSVISPRGALVSELEKKEDFRAGISSSSSSSSSSSCHGTPSPSQFLDTRSLLVNDHNQENSHTDINSVQSLIESYFLLRDGRKPVNHGKCLTARNNLPVHSNDTATATATATAATSTPTVTDTVISTGALVDESDQKSKKSVEPGEDESQESFMSGWEDMFGPGMTTTTPHQERFEDPKNLLLTSSSSTAAFAPPAPLLHIPPDLSLQTPSAQAAVDLHTTSAASTITSGHASLATEGMAAESTRRTNMSSNTNTKTLATSTRTTTRALPSKRDRDSSRTSGGSKLEAVGKACTEDLKLSGLVVLMSEELFVHQVRAWCTAID